MNNTFSATEARSSLPQILDQVELGAEVTLTRHGKPVAVIVHPDALTNRRIDAQALATSQRLRRLIHDARTRPLAKAGTLSAANADALAATVRADRDTG